MRTKSNPAGASRLPSADLLRRQRLRPVEGVSWSGATRRRCDHPAAEKREDQAARQLGRRSVASRRVPR